MAGYQSATQVMRGGRIVWRNAALRNLLEGDGGPVGRELRRRTTAIVSIAKVKASGRPGPRVITGQFRAGITSVVSRDGGGMYGAIGTNAVQARALELGHPRWPPGVKYPTFGPALEEAKRKGIVH
jgi:hypothetical protein